MLKPSTLEYLKNKKNLLAFSAGVDSTALFFLLQNAEIDFDIAIVDYNVREQSKDEVNYAKQLASKYNLTCHLHDAKTIEKNFEANARAIRYDFFETLIKEYKYKNLLTAHHLGDRFEWMLMQFCKGAGCVEIAGMKEYTQKENYTLVRPLLHLDKSELLEFLHNHNIDYFEDESNLDDAIVRNNFRHTYSNPLLQKHLDGIKKSFEYIDKDRELLEEDIQVHTLKELHYFQTASNITANIRVIDRFLKHNGYLLSAHEREALQTEKTTVVGRKFLINQTKKMVFVLPYTKDSKETLPKEFKESCRVLKIEPKLRVYLYKNPDVFKKVKELLS